uniref:Sulfatase N-terminal domain-containing protein n=1 Tax=Ditylum brightwellii TaxID=49249 RepID=A0A7S4RHL9_9STRA
MPTASVAAPIILTAFSYAVFWINGVSCHIQRVVFAGTFLLSYLYNTAFLVIDAMTGDGLNDSVFYHLDQGMEGAGLGQFMDIIQKAVVAILFGFALTVAILMRAPQRREGKKLSRTCKMLPVAAIVLSYLVHPMSFALHDQYLLQDAVNDAPVIKEEVRSLFQQTYKDPREISNFEAGKNIVYIYMESLERNYIKLPGVAPNLERWEKEGVSFTNITQGPGTGWTIAGIVASLCGIPLVTTGGKGNSMHGAKDFLPGVTCLSDMLQKAGYHQTYMGGADINFAGKGSFLKSHGFDDVIGKNELMTNELKGKSTGHGWGITDDLLLDVVFDKYKELSAADKPFALYTLTLDTHGTSPSPRCREKKVVRGDRSYKDSVRCSDYLLNNFFNQVFDEQRKRGKNDTLIIVNSDHLAMPYHKPTELERLGPRRNTFFVLGSSNTSSESHSMLGTTMDVPATILSLLGYPGKAFGFGRDLTIHESLAKQDPNFLEDLKTKMWNAMRKIFWAMPNIMDSPSIEVDTNAKNLRVGGKVYSIPILISADLHGLIDEIIFFEDTPVAYSKHSGTTIAVDNCKYFKSQLGLNDKNFCLFIKHQSSPKGWIRMLPLNSIESVSVDLNADLNMTAPAPDFIRASLCESANQCKM